MMVSSTCDPSHVRRIAGFCLPWRLKPFQFVLKVALNWLEAVPAASSPPFIIDILA